MPTADDLRRIAVLATEAAQRMSHGGDAQPAPPAGLGVLLAEMQALLQVLPGTAVVASVPHLQATVTDAEVEAGFDFMPV
jgi:hypothetical protein